jgi:poly-beta-1,6-N-acetyl-D-glucosamine synthase
VIFPEITYENFLYLISGIFLFSLLTQLIYYFFIYSRIIFHRRDPLHYQELKPVSVIICARNEENNLRAFLPKVLEQVYPLYEVIVVNDCSWDNTKELLEELSQKYKHLKTTTIREDEKFRHGKKLAVTVGIKAASYEQLLLTDADCEPASENWLKEMQKNFSKEKELVLGYGGYFREKGILNNLIRYETMTIAMQYMGYALAGMPYMGVGRNLAYKRDLFFRNKGFANHLDIMSGDDDLFVQQVACKKNTTVQFSHDSHTRSIPEKTTGSWFSQKKRHLTTGWRYKGKIKFFLSLEVFTRYLLIASFIFLLINEFYTPYLIGLFLLRFLVFLTVIKFVMKRLNEKYLFIPSLFYDILLPLTNIAAIISNFAVSKRNKWK